jgi:drug/metabolite transporter (DMT)-like permease
LSNREKTLRTYVMVLLFVALRGVGNLWLAVGTRHFSQSLSIHPAAYLSSMLEPFVAGGVILMILALFARLALLSLADLGFVLPVTAIGYVLAAVLGKFFLAENVSPQRWLATLLIFAGAVLVGSTSQNTTAKEAAK